MKLWKILVSLPYVLILVLFVYILWEITKPTASWLAGIALVVPITLAVFYTIVLGIALILRWVIIKRKK